MRALKRAAMVGLVAPLALLVGPAHSTYQDFTPSPPLAEETLTLAELASARTAHLQKQDRSIQDASLREALAAREEILEETANSIKAEEEALRAAEEAATYAWPAQGEFGSPFGMRLHPILKYKRMHWGVDVGAACGSPLLSIHEGVVTGVAEGAASGKNVTITHRPHEGKELVSSSLHMARIDVREGQKVAKGEQIGTVGNTGLSTECHLHLETTLDGEKVDPSLVITGKPHTR